MKMVAMSWRRLANLARCQRHRSRTAPVAKTWTLAVARPVPEHMRRYPLRNQYFSVMEPLPYTAQRSRRVVIPAVTQAVSQ